MILYFVKFIGSDDETPIYGPFSVYDKAESWMEEQIDAAIPPITQKVIDGVLYSIQPHLSGKAIRGNWEIVTAVLDTGQEII